MKNVAGEQELAIFIICRKLFSVLFKKFPLSKFRFYWYIIHMVSEQLFWIVKNQQVSAKAIGLNFFEQLCMH